VPEAGILKMNNLQ